VRVLHLTDTHLYAQPDTELYRVKTRHSLRAVIEHARQHLPHIDLVLVTGDLVHDESRRGYEALHQLVETLGKPVFFIPGNHDDLQLMAQVLPGFSASGFRALEMDSWAIVLLDSSSPGRVEGEVSQQSLLQLDDYLGQHRAKPVLVAVHHHLIDIQSPWLDALNLHNRNDLIGILERYPQVKVVINGHIHQELDKTCNDIRYLGTPATCFQFAPRQQKAVIDDKPPGYRYLVLEPDGTVQTTVNYLPGYSH